MVIYGPLYQQMTWIKTVCALPQRRGGDARGGVAARRRAGFGRAAAAGDHNQLVSHARGEVGQLHPFRKREIAALVHRHTRRRVWSAAAGVC